MSRRAVPTPVRMVAVVLLLYVFLVGISLLETGIAGLGSGFTDGLLASVANPVSGLFAGLLFTVLVQSSSVSTSAIVGLVGAGTLTVPLAVPMIMGANIGTTVTNTFAALGNIRRPDEFQRGFAAATMHDFFNLLAVLVLLPIELATGVLASSADALTDVLRGRQVSEVGASPIKRVVSRPVELIDSLVPDSGQLAAVLFLGCGLALIFLALGAITSTMRQLVAGSIEQAFNRVVSRGAGAIGILVGLLVTVAVQSSSITTSILVPLVAAGILSVQNAYPVTIGANVGTTVTALIASLAVVSPDGLTIALVHTLFNVFALVLLYPLPWLRKVPVQLAQTLATAAVRRRSYVIAYILIVFLLIPILGVAILP